MTRAAKPEPGRPLGRAGSEFWDATWEKGSWPADVELLLMVCEQMDERVALRVRVLQGKEPRRELRDLDKLIVQGLQMLGIATGDRSAPVETGPAPKRKKQPAGELEASLTSTLSSAAWLKPSDKTAIDLALQYARRIDTALDTGEGQEVTKALYLGPHLLNTLRELGMTPGARKDLDIEGEVSGKLDDLRKRASLTSITGGKTASRK